MDTEVITTLTPSQPPLVAENTACSTKHIGLALAYWHERFDYPRRTLIIGQLAMAEIEAQDSYRSLLRNIRLDYEQTGSLDTETLERI
jgi:hypothetical protein